MQAVEDTDCEEDVEKEWDGEDAALEGCIMAIEGGDIYMTRGEAREKKLYGFGGENKRGRWRCVRGLFRTLRLWNAAFGHRGSGGSESVRMKMREETWWCLCSFKCPKILGRRVREHVGE